MKLRNEILSTSSPSQSTINLKKATNYHRHKLLYSRKGRRYTGKELDAETGLYYYGARYLDPRVSRWLSGDPAMYQGDYLPSAPINDEARRRNGNLPGGGGIFNYVNMHVYHYGGNNPIKYIDPDGRTATYSIDHDNKTVNINVNIIIFGEDATNEIAQIYKDGIEDAWGGSWSTDIKGEQYTVNFNVNVSVGKAPGLFKRLWNRFIGTNNFIKADASIDRSFVSSGFLGTWRSEGRSGNTLANDNPAAHEFGHLLGFKDRYTDSGGADPNWRGNIMAESAMRGFVDQRNINAISAYITQPSKRSNGVIRHWRMSF